MASEAVVEIDKLLEPISEESPTGNDLREVRSDEYYQVKDARNSARAEERNSLFNEEEVNTLVLWQPLLELCPQILESQSKDLEVACWYLEALIRNYDFSGLRDGIKLINGLVENFWEGLYPVPDEDGMETKVAPLTGLNGDSGEGTLLSPMRNLEVTQLSNSGTYSFWQYQQAQEASKIQDDNARKTRFDTLGYHIDQILDAVNGSSPNFYQDIVDDIEEAKSSFSSLVSTLRSNCGLDAPPSSNITEILDELLRTVRFISKDKLESLAESQEEDNTEEETEESGDGWGSTNIHRHHCRHHHGYRRTHSKPGRCPKATPRDRRVFREN